MSTSHEHEENEVFSRAAKATELLYQLRDRFFPSNPQEKTSKLLHDSNRILQLIDSIPLEKRSLPMQQAKFEYLRGKVLDVTDDYRKEAEDHLTKAVELNPSLADAWLCLSNCISKKGDLAAANKCLDLALTKVGHDVDENIRGQLLMLKGKFVHGVKNQEEIADESIQHARDAIALDVKDGNSCYCDALGYMISCFVSGCMEGKMLIKSFKAFEDVEKMEKNPKYTYNHALTYMQSVNLSASSFYVPDNNSMSYLNNGAAVSEVEIDLLTGETRFLQTDIIYDCGQSLNPAVDLGQIEGAFVQGLGFFMLEEYETNGDGLVLADGTWNYKIPTIDTIPRQFNVQILNSGHHQHRVLFSKGILCVKLQRLIPRAGFWRAAPTSSSFGSLRHKSSY